MTLTIIRRDPEATNASGRTPTEITYEHVPEDVVREIVDELTSYWKTEDRPEVSKKQYRLPSGEAKTIVLSYQEIVAIYALPE